MQPRLIRYKEFIERDYLKGLLKNKEYSLEIKKELEEKIRNKKFKRILFTGMGCSAIVSDIIKGFFSNKKIPIQVEVINDYQLDYLLDKEIFKDEKTLVIISSYSGYSQEPINAYEEIKKLTKDIIFLTSGGKLGQIANKDQVSTIYWKIENPDREYPLFHATQYFSILLDIFHKLNLLDTNYEKEIVETVNYLKKEFNKEKINQAKQIAKRMENKDIILLASPKWYLTLLKLADMHINEMAMAPSHRNYLHEFGHSEVAILSDPKMKQFVAIFKDSEEDQYTKDKIKRIKELLKEGVKQNKNIDVEVIDLNQKDFLKKFFSSLLFIQYISYYLGIYYDFKSRELISIAAGNSWYNIKTIKKELGKKSKDYSE